jgi:hypothetical protein
MKYLGNLTSPTLGIILGLLSVGVVAGAVLFRSVGGRRAADTAVAEPTRTGGIPPIDASAPIHTETATFALG